MRKAKTLKKIALIGFIMCLIIVCFSLTAFAYDYIPNEYKGVLYQSTGGINIANFNVPEYSAIGIGCIFNAVEGFGDDGARIYTFYIENYALFMNKMKEYANDGYNVDVLDYFNINVATNSKLNSIVNSTIDCGNIIEINGIIRSVSTFVLENRSLNGQVTQQQVTINQLSNQVDELDRSLFWLNVAYESEIEQNVALNNEIDTLTAEKNNLQVEIYDLQVQLKNIGNNNYTEGYNDGLNASKTFKEGLLTIFSAPMYILNEIFNFEIFGINFYEMIKFFLTLLVVTFLIKKFI